MAKNERYETYTGIDRVMNNWAKVFREPVQKWDKFEHDGPRITKVYRDGALLFRLGKKYSIKPKGSFIKIVHIEVDPNPGNMPLDEAVKEGFVHLGQFRKGFSRSVGDDALWRPAWRIEFEIHLSEEEPEVDDPDPVEGEEVENTKKET